MADASQEGTIDLSAPAGATERPQVKEQFISTMARWYGLMGTLPLIATILAGLCIAALAYSTLKSIRNRDANLTESLWIWLAAAGCSLILSTAIPSEYRSMGVPILLILVAAATLPCFTTASELRAIRTS